MELAAVETLWACGATVAHVLYTDGVAGSNPVGPTKRKK